MTFELPALTAVIALFALALALVVGLLTGLAITFLARNRAVRVARHEPLLRHYGHLVHGH